jgi:dTDP-D-glucose 4,6-dehydratase
MMCKAYMTSYKLPIIITRGNNVYGPHQVRVQAMFWGSNEQGSMA